MWQKLQYVYFFMSSLNIFHNMDLHYLFYWSFSINNLSKMPKYELAQMVHYTFHSEISFTGNIVEKAFKGASSTNFQELLKTFILNFWPMIKNDTQVGHAVCICVSIVNGMGILTYLVSIQFQTQDNSQYFCGDELYWYSTKIVIMLIILTCLWLVIIEINHSVALSFGRSWLHLLCFFCRLGADTFTFPGKFLDKSLSCNGKYHIIIVTCLSRKGKKRMEKRVESYYTMRVDLCVIWQSISLLNN